jgi:hypothetical protein
MQKNFEENLFEGAPNYYPVQGACIYIVGPNNNFFFLNLAHTRSVSEKFIY